MGRNHTKDAVARRSGFKSLKAEDDKIVMDKSHWKRRPSPCGEHDLHETWIEICTTMVLSILQHPSTFQQQKAPRLDLSPRVEACLPMSRTTNPVLRSPDLVSLLAHRGPELALGESGIKIRNHRPPTRTILHVLQRPAMPSRTASLQV